MRQRVQMRALICRSEHVKAAAFGMIRIVSGNGPNATAALIVP